MKAYNTPNIGSYVAGEDLSAKQYHFVKWGTVAGQVVLCDAASEKTIGILMNQPASGEAAEVALPGGGAKLVVDANVGYGDSVRTGADGKGETAAADGDWVGALVDATGVADQAADDVVPVIVTATYQYIAP